MRVDKAKNIKKIAPKLLLDPIQTDRELEQKTWVWKSTINRIKNELGQIGAKDERILWVCETDFEIVKIWQEIIKNRLQDKEEVSKMRTFEIAQTIEKSEKRYSLFIWDITDKEWWLKEVIIEM